MAFPWLSIVGHARTDGLASECSVHLTPNLVRFINLFGDQIDAVVSSPDAALSNTGGGNQVLEKLIDVARTEVREFREAHIDRCFQIEQLNVMEQPRNFTPIIYCKLRGLPVLLVHITRTYADQRAFVSPSWKAPDGGCNIPSGQVQDAVNFVTAACRHCNHRISISEVLEMWITHGLCLSIREPCATAAAGARLSKLSQVSRGGHDVVVGVKTTEQVVSCDISGYASDKSYETASVPYMGGGARKKASPARSMRVNHDFSCDSRGSRRNWRPDVMPVISNPSVSQSHLEASVDHGLDLSGTHFSPARIPFLRPVTNAELRASVNAALRKDTTSGEELRSSLTASAVSTENISPPPASSTMRNAESEWEAVSPKDVFTRPGKNLNQSDAGDCEGTVASTDTFEFRELADDSNCTGVFSAIAAPSNEFDEMVISLDDMLTASPSLVNKVLETGVENFCTGEEIPDDMSFE
eukprot:GFKZ01012177.1.p1 GENE.GFKZ01012177.1~~GFKZ01012177.1.p1  ORF type:complete len:469 (+),score=44.52 GFKZ01012177.1:209-1615(+)